MASPFHHIHFRARMTLLWSKRGLIFFQLSNTQGEISALSREHKGTSASILVLEMLAAQGVIHA